MGAVPDEKACNGQAANGYSRHDKKSDARKRRNYPARQSRRSPTPYRAGIMTSSFAQKLSSASIIDAVLDTGSITASRKIADFDDILSSFKEQSYTALQDDMGVLQNFLRAFDDARIKATELSILKKWGCGDGLQGGRCRNAETLVAGRKGRNAAQRRRAPCTARAPRWTAEAVIRRTVELPSEQIGTDQVSDRILAERSGSGARRTSRDRRNASDPRPCERHRSPKERRPACERRVGRTLLCRHGRLHHSFIPRQRYAGESARSDGLWPARSYRRHWVSKVSE